MAYTATGSGTSGAVIYCTGTDTLAGLITFIASNTSYATVYGDSIVFNCSLSIGNGSTTANWTASDCTLVFLSTYTFTVPNNSAQSGTSTTLSDVAIIFDVSAKSYGNAVNYGTHTWTRVVYRSQVTSGRSDLFSNTGCVFNFNNVQLAVSSTASAYPYDYIHQYNNSTVTVQGLTITGLGGTGSGNNVEFGSATGTTTTLQGLTLGGVIGDLTLNNGGTSYSGTQDFRSLSWPNNSTWSFNPGSGGALAYITNPNKPTGWLGYSFITGGAGGSGTVTERYTHDVTTVNSLAAGVQNINVGDYTSGAVATLGTLNGGAAYTYGTYLNVPLTGGSGTGALANISVSHTAVVTAVTLVSGGYGYAVSDTLSASTTNLGGAGSGFSIPVATIYASAFIWAVTSGSTGAITEQYVKTAVIAGSAGAATTYYTRTVDVVAWGYGYNTFVGSRTFSPSGTGVTDTILMNSDVTTTPLASTVNGWTSLTSLNDLYDASRNWNTLNTTNILVPALGTNIITYSGLLLNLGSYNLVINSGTTTAGNAFSVSGSTITIYASSLPVGSKFTSFTTTGTVTVGSGVTVTASFTTTAAVTNNGTINAVYSSNAGQSGAITFTNMGNNSTIITDLGVLTSNSTGTVTVYNPPGSNSTFHYSVTKYGYLPVAGTVAGNSGSQSVNAIQTIDPGITVSSATTVNGYSSLSTLDNLYDYWSLYLYGYGGTTSGTAGQQAYFNYTKAGTWSTSTAPLSKNGTAISVYSAITTLILSTSAISGTTATSASSITIAGVSANILTGTTYQTLSAGSVTTFTDTGITPNFQYTVSAGTSGILSFSGLQAGSTIYIYTASGGTAQLSTPTTIAGTSTTFSIPPNAGVAWIWKIVKYNYLPLYVNGTYTSNTVVSNSVTQLTDTGISNTLTPGSASSVTTYTVLSTADQLYDYIAYWETLPSSSGGGIAYTRPSTKNGRAIDFAAQNIILSNTSSSPLVSYNSTAPGTLTAYVGASLSVGTTTFTSNTSSAPTITTTGTITFAGSTPTVTGSAILKSGTATGTSALISTYISLSGLPTITGSNSVVNGSAVYVVNGSSGSGTQVNYQSSLTGGIYSYALPMAAQGSYSYKVTCYGDTSSGFVNFTTQGTVSQTISLSTDLGITNTSGTGTGGVSTYTSITNADMLYDYLAYWETQQPSSNGGIGYTRLTTKAGKSMNFGSYNLILKGGTNSPPLSFNGTTTATIYVGALLSLGVGTSTFTANTSSSPTVYTTGTITFASSAVTGSAILQSGTSPVITSGYLSLSGLSTNSSVYVTAGSSGSGGALTTGINILTGTTQTNPLITASTTSYGLAIPMNSSTTYSYKVAIYGSVSSGFVNFSPQGTASVNISLSTDTGITQPYTNVASVSAYSTLETLDKLYDYSAYWDTQAAGIVYNRFTSKNSATVSLGSVNLTVTNTGSAWSVTGTVPTVTALTIDAGSVLAAGATTFSQFSTNGTVTITSSSITCLYTVSGSTSYLLQLTGILAYTSTLGQAYISITNGSNGTGTQLINTNVSGTYSYSLPPGTSGTYSYKIAQYGNISTGFVNFSPGVGGVNSVAINLSSDLGITNTTVSSGVPAISLNTTLTTLDQIYDYAAYWETTNNTGGITVARPVSKNGTQVGLGSNSFTYSSSASPVWAYSGTAITINGSTLTNGSVWASLLTTSTATFSGTTVNHAVIYSSGNNSGILTITIPSNLISAGGASVYVQNASGAQQAWIQNQTTSPYVVYIPLGSTGTWTWVVKRAGYTFALGTFNASTGGQYAASPSTPQKLNADGSVMYTGSSSALATVSFNGTTEADIKIGNGSVSVQTILDTTETALTAPNVGNTTSPGMIWLASGKGECSQFLSANGNFIFLSSGWRFEVATAGNASTVNGFAVSADNVTTNTTNGLVTFLTSTQASDVAAAVWNSLVSAYTTSGTMGAQLSLAEAQAALAAALSA